MQPYRQVVVNDYGRRSGLALVLAVVQLSVALLLLLAALGKILEFGVHGHVSHFTNWSWSLQTFFYFTTLGAPFIQLGLIDADSPLGVLTQTLLVLLFFPLNGVVWVVVIVVQVLLGTDAAFLVELLLELPPTLVMLGNDVFHFWPIIFVLLYALAYGKLILYAHNKTLNRFGAVNSGVRLAFYVLYQAFGGTAIAVLMYSVIFNPQQVYKTDIHVLVGIVIAAAVLALFNLVPLLLLFGLVNVGSKTAYTRSWLVTNLYDPTLQPPMKQV